MTGRSCKHKNDSQKSKIWSRDFAILTCVNFFSSLIFYLLCVSMVDYARVVFEVGVGGSSLSVSLYIIGALVGRFALGAKIDDWGAQKSLRVGYLFNALVALFYFLPIDIYQFLAIRTIHGIAFSLQSGAGATGAAILIPSHRKAEGISYYSISQALGTAIGPFFASIFMKLNVNYQLFFWFLFLISTIAFLGSLLVKIPIAPIDTHKVKRNRLLESIYIPVIPISCVMLIMFFCYGSVMSFILGYATEINLEDAMVFFFPIYAAALFVCRIFIGKIIDNNDPKYILYFAILAIALSFLLISTAKALPSFAIAAILLGIGLGSVQSVTQSMVISISPLESQGKANSTYLVALDVGSGLGPIFFGVLASIIGFRFSYGIFGGIALLGILIFKNINKDISIK